MPLPLTNVNHSNGTGLDRVETRNALARDRGAPTYMRGEKAVKLNDMIS